MSHINGTSRSAGNTPPGFAGNIPAHPHDMSGADLSFHPDNAMKVTRGHSCILCQQRKVRCDKAKPCSNCVKAGVECRVVPPQPPRRRKKRIPERDLVERLRKYEALLTQAGVEFESLGPDVKITDPGTVEEGDELDADFMRKKESNEFDPDLISSPGERPHVPKTFKWFPFQKEFRVHEDILRDSSDEEDMGSSINNAFDKMFDDQDAFGFLVGVGYQSVTELHPTVIQILQLWQVYLTNVNPILKLTHTPTLQGRIVEASANLEKVSRSLEALMFAIYMMALTSMGEDEVQNTFGENKLTMITRFSQGTQQALMNAGFLKYPDLTSMQAFFLYMLGVRHYVDPRILFCLTGMGVRLAHRMGLHRDGAQFRLSPFEVEERRRLWWNMAGFDRRIGEMTGSTITAISTGGDCKLPLNINDADLHLHAKDAPTPHMGTTEMIYALTRLEFSKAPGNDKMKSTLSESNPQAVANLADHRLSVYLERFSSYMEETYLKQCDPKIPLHLFTILMTRQNMCKLKIMSGFFRTALQIPAALSESETEKLFIEAIKMIQYDTEIQKNKDFKGFLWYTRMHFPFPAYVALLNELRTRTTGELCERAWATLTENHDARGMSRWVKSPMHLAFSSLYVKAWDARAEAEAALGRTIIPPPVINIMRQAPRKHQSSRGKTPSSVSASASPPSVGQPDGSRGYPTPMGSAEMQMPSLYPNQGFMGGAGIDMNKQMGQDFGGMNFGGALDLNYLMNEYGSFIPQEYGGMSNNQQNTMWMQMQ